MPSYWNVAEGIICGKTCADRKRIYVVRKRNVSEAKKVGGIQMEIAFYNT